VQAADVAMAVRQKELEVVLVVDEEGISALEDVGAYWPGSGFHRNSTSGSLPYSAYTLIAAVYRTMNLPLIPAYLGGLPPSSAGSVAPFDGGSCIA
jgi:hypothetical protein